MGQCYSVYIQSKDINEEILKELTEKWSEIYDIKIHSGELKDILESLFGDDASIVAYDHCKTLTSAFEASYAWHTHMIQWFNFVAPAFTPDVTMEIFPDEGKTKSWVDKDGKIVTKEYEWDEMCDDEPRLAKWAQKIFKHVSLTEEQQYVIKKILGEHCEIYGLEDEYDDNDDPVFTDEEMKKIYSIEPDE